MHWKMWIKWFLSVLKNVAMKGLVVGSIHHPVVQYKGQCTSQPSLKGLHVHRPSIKDAGHQSVKYKRCTIPVTQLRKGITLLSQGEGAAHQSAKCKGAAHQSANYNGAAHQSANYKGAVHQSPRYKVQRCSAPVSQLQRCSAPVT